MNGVDNLSYLNIATSAVVPFTTVTTPAAAPTLSADNVGGSGYNIYYRYSENSTVGETAASPALTVDVDTDRDLWTGGDNVVITLPAAAPGTQSRNVYMGVVSGFEYLIASGLDPATVTFTDDGTRAQDLTRLYPTTNSTAGPRTTRGEVISGRAWMVGDADNPYYVWNGGDPGFELDFSPANGGNFNLVGNGTKDLPVAVKSFRDGKGTPQVTVLCQGTNGSGKRFILTSDSITLGSSVLTFFDITEDSGGDGTESPDAVILYGTDLHYPSRDGFKTTGTLPQIQNVLSSRRTSNTIQPDLKLLNLAAMGGACGLAFEGRLYFALPVSSNSNNEIWVLDLDRKGAWMKPWSISADWMTLYNDNTGNTHFLILSNNVIFSLSYSALTTDDGRAFITSGQSGEVYFSDDHRIWAQLLMVVITVLRPQGEINFQITGKTEDDDDIALGDPFTYTSSGTTIVTGWGETDRLMVGWGRLSWSEVGEVATGTNAATVDIPIEIDEEVQWAAYSWNSSKVGTDYNISKVVYEYVETGVKDLS